PEHLAAAQSERRVARLESVDRQNRLTYMPGTAWKQRPRRASDHHGDDAVVRRAGGGAAAGIPSIAEHGEPIGDLGDLLDEMRDIDDRMPLSAQFLQHREQSSRVLPSEAAGRLVQDEHSAAD